MSGTEPAQRLRVTDAWLIDSETGMAPSVSSEYAVSVDVARAPPREAR